MVCRQRDGYAGDESGRLVVRMSWKAVIAAWILIACGWLLTFNGHDVEGTNCFLSVIVIWAVSRSES